MLRLGQVSDGEVPLAAGGGVQLNPAVISGAARFPACKTSATATQTARNPPQAMRRSQSAMIIIMSIVEITEHPIRTFEGR